MGKKQFILIGAGAILLIAASFLSGRWFERNRTTDSAADADNYPLLSRRIFFEEASTPLVGFNPLRQDLRRYFEDNKLSGSIYFEYLPTGTSIRIGDNNQEIIASLIKVPAAMELYKAHERGLLDLGQTVALESDWLDSSFGSLYEKGAGYELTLREAAEYMLRESDNTALAAISAQTGTILDPNDSVFNALDVDFVLDNDRALWMNARSYSSILKCLYFSCHLSYEHSNEILELLTQSNHTSRLPAGISDKDIKVAHKYGTYGDLVQGDCGIIYLPQKNYVLCIMLDGGDTPATDNHFKEMSEKVFEFVNQQGS